MVTRKKTAAAEAPWEKEAGTPAKVAAATKAVAASKKTSAAAKVKDGLPSSEAEEKKEVGPPPSGVKVPKNPAEAADLYKELQLKETTAKKFLEEIETQRKWVKAWLIQELPKSGASGIAGKLCRVATVQKETPRAEDWSKIYQNIVADYQGHVKKKTGMEDSAFSMLQKRLGEAAVKELWEAGKTVEGVSKFTYTDLSVAKL